MRHHTRACAFITPLGPVCVHEKLHIQTEVQRNQTCMHGGAQRIEPEASRMQSRCDTTMPCVQVVVFVQTLHPARTSCAQPCGAIIWPANFCGARRIVCARVCRSVPPVSAAPHAWASKASVGHNVGRCRLMRFAAKRRKPRSKEV